MPLVASLFFVAMVSLLGALYVPAQQARAAHAVSDAASTSILAYRESVIDYLNANPSITGTIPDTSLTYVWGYWRDPRWTHVVSGGTLYVHEVTANSVNTSLMLDQLYRKTASSYTVGRAVSGMLVSANGFSTGVPVPSSVPNGSILIVGK